MNLELRDLIEDKSRESNLRIRYKYVFIYWWNRSQLLGCYNKGGDLKYHKKIKRLKKEGARWARVARSQGEDPLKLLDGPFINFAKKVLNP